MELHLPTINPEIIGSLAGLPITNTIINAWIAIVIFLILGLFISKHVSLYPGKVQNGAEYFLDILLGYFDQVTGAREKTLRFLPIVGAIFFFILLSNWLGLIPGTGTITASGQALLRPASSDLNLTAAMAIVAVASSHIFGFFTIGVFAHLNKFIQLKAIWQSLSKGPMALFTALIMFAAGLIEIVSEVAKILSLSLRLFGNIFAGEILLSVMASIVGLLVPVPFMFLELLVGIVQAGVFAMLAMSYFTITTAPAHEAGH